MFGANVLGYTLGAILKGTAHLAKHPVGQGLLFGLALYAAATHERWRPDARARLERSVHAAKGFIDSSVEVFDAFRQVYEDASAVWSGAGYLSDEAGIRRQVARILAASPAPMSRAQVAAVLIPHESERTRRALVKDLAHVLSSSRAFVREGRHWWQLGVEGPDFGFLPPEMPLEDRYAIPKGVVARLPRRGSA